MTTPTGRQYIEQFRNLLSQTPVRSQTPSPYTSEAAAAMTPEQVSFSGYGASIDLAHLGRPRGSSLRSGSPRGAGTIPAQSITRPLAERSLAHGLATLSPRRAVVVPPRLGPDRSSTGSRSHSTGRRDSTPTRLAGPRRGERRSLDQLMRGTYSSDRDLDALMTSSFDGSRRSTRGRQAHTLPSLGVERQIRPGRGWETSLRDDSQLNTQLRDGINEVNGHFSRADALRRQALRLGSSSPAGREAAMEACREYQAFRSGRQQLQQRAHGMPEAQRSRVEAWAQHRIVQRSERDFTRLIRRFGLAQ